MTARATLVGTLGLVLVALLTMAAMGLAAGGCGGDSLPSAGGDGGGTETTESGAQDGDLSAGLNGAGATFPRPLYIEWIGEFQAANPDVKINYQGIGSGGGIEQFTKLTVDFGASDAPMTDEEIAAAEAAGGAQVLHIPTVFGSVVLAYNLGDVSDLKLDADTLSAIYLGEITTWNDSRIAALNADASLPDKAIQAVHRSDSSGTTSIFTNYLSEVSSAFAEAVGPGKEVQWPSGVGGQGNDGVAAVVQQQEGSIGYVELSYALESGLPMASLMNQAGNFITPTLESTSAAADGASFPEDLRFSVSNSPNPEAYPIVGATWILAYEQMADAAKVAALKAWLDYSLTEGTALAEELGYAPLPDTLRGLALAKVDTISAF
jgi:phosphate transport system substrate-binding protein